MKLTPLGKIILLLFALGVGIGGFRIWRSAKSGHSNTPIANNGTPNGGGLKLPKLPTFGGQNNNQNNQVPNPGDPNAANQLILVSSASKKGWLGDQIDKFNQQHPDTPVVLRTYETREGMHAILSGSVKPALYSPSSFIWADRLAQAWQEQSGGEPILDTQDDSSYRVILRTPIVFLTTKSKASFLRPLLSSEACWKNIQALSTGKKKAPWGSIKWAHADPLNSNSGALTLALILSDYATKSGQGAAIDTLVHSQGFANYLQSTESRLVYNTAVQKGSSALLKSFTEDPSRYDFIAAYESTSIDAIQNDPSLVVIYPSPTANAENSIAALSGSWLTPAQKTAARAFVKFLGTPEAAQDGLKEHFRPVRGASLDAEIAQLAGNGLRQSYPTIELPPYSALNSAAVVWRSRIARK